jgi:predicted alpha/beta-hydrolase family hydrolase
MTATEIPTPHGPARVSLHSADQGVAALLLGHGAGGGIDAPDLVAVARAARAVDVHVALVEQPYRVAGRKAPAPAKQLDAAWLAVAAHLAETTFEGLPLVFGGRSSGARVACRTAGAGGADAVLCLAFPEHPPGRPEKSRQAELDAVEGPHHEIVTVAGDHSLKADLDAVSRAASEWLGRVLRPLVA